MFKTLGIKRFFRYVIFITVMITGANLLVSCEMLVKKPPVLPAGVKGFLIIDGYAISGSSNRIWEYDIENRRVLEFKNNSLLEVLNSYYESTSNDNQYRRDMKAAKKLNGVKNMLKNPFSVERFLGDKLNEFIDKNFKDDLKMHEISHKKPQDEDQEIIVSPSGEFKVKVDYENRTIDIKNNLNKEQKLLTLEHELCCEAISPASDYLAFFEYQPFAFNDGKTYMLRFVDLRTGEFFSIQHSQVAMPTGMLWLNEESLNSLDPHGANLQ